LISFESIINEIRIRRIDPLARKLAEKYGYRPYMVQRYLEMMGFDECVELLEAFETLRPPPTIRCNNLRIDCNELVTRLERLGFELEPVPWCNYCYNVVKAPRSPSIGATHEYLKGYYYVYRDAAPTIPPIICAPKPRWIVLDVCAAPGGKATHLLQQMEDRGLLVANEISRPRIALLLTHLHRMGFKSFIVLNEDGRVLPYKLRLEFDYILVDAPCSAEGRIMYDPSRKTKTSEEDLAQLVLREIELLSASIRLAKPGAFIVYATCSIAPEENEYVVSKVLELHRNVEIIEPFIRIGDRGLTGFAHLTFDPRVSRCVRLWPHKHKVEGFFVCIFRKM